MIFLFPLKASVLEVGLNKGRKGYINKTNECFLWYWLLSFYSSKNINGHFENKHRLFYEYIFFF